MGNDVEKATNFETFLEDDSELSLKQKIQIANDEENAKSVSCFVICGSCLGRIGCHIISLFFSGLPVAMIIFGAINLHNCPLSNFIPIYLLVQGISTILDRAVVHFHCRSKEDDTDTDMETQSGLVFDTFVVIWFIIGSVYVYQIYEPNYDPSLGDYCDKTTYLIAFWSMTTVYALGAFLIIMCCCISLVMCFLDKYT